MFLYLVALSTKGNVPGAIPLPLFCKSQIVRKNLRGPKNQGSLESDPEF